MDNNTPTVEDELVLANELELVSPTTVAGTLYGIAFTLFCLYVHSLAPHYQDQDRKGRAKFMLGYSSIIMLFGLYIVVANTWYIQDAYIKHGDYPGGPYAYALSAIHTQPAIFTSFICQFSIEIMTSAIQVWRVWVVWSATKYVKLVIILPILCLLTIAGQVNGSPGYIKIIAMLVESYALESIWVLLAAIFFLHGAAIFFLESRTNIQIIAYLLVQYRVASGKAYESQRGQSNISALRWNHSNHATTQLEETSEAVTAGGRHAPVKLEADALPALSNMA
ncbi:hypothetical protein AGABI2DRAFT_181669 [Agaricus bisporus var. bisporus H97]|uniref:hypothetical protein n=1 Tax=Agaricus bisporus var. bisporus (strain H97 / ATCC MYA-4626 / FGSC 10389) TaxID=936046 RepID=UPI00029F7208|nr:hypothetical protein AGABI2DRAFT_181669 [Agaricus bisporus var. bisporus H97]EKV41858.1 hypothetical protein AGABI2DRAFT_181669 [Agaricus bisporus var. bisporus H97]